MARKNNYGQDAYGRVPIAPGNPPLTREMCDAYIELVFFAVAVIQGRQPAPVPQEVKDAFVQQAASFYPAMSPQDQAGLANAPAMWAQVQAEWPRLSPAQREMTRNAWAQQFGPYLQAQSQPAQWNPYQYTNDEPTTDDLVNQILDSDEQEVEKMRAQNPELAKRMEADLQAKYMQMLSSMSNTRYDSMMAVARNFRS